MGGAPLVKVLVIRAHPLDDSFNFAVLQATLNGLAKAGHETTLIDLYKDDFDPRLKAEERRTYHDHHHVPEDVQRYVELIRASDAMVYVFPTWCFGVPAILKGFFDRVFRPGVAFHIDGAVVTPLFTHIKKVAGVSTDGHWYGRSATQANHKVRDVVLRETLQNRISGALSHERQHGGESRCVSGQG
jgi:NAD(P)H dehydrogenase (quinone)